MPIKIVYGKNGAGKTLYANEKQGKGVRVFDSNVDLWEFETNRISEFKTLEKYWNNLIQSKIDSIFDPEVSSLFSDQTSANRKKWLSYLQKFSKENDFNSFDAINNHAFVEMNEMNLSNVSLMDLYIFILGNESIPNATNSQFEAALVYKSIEKISDEQFETVEIRNINTNLLNIKNQLVQIIGGAFSALDNVTASTIKRLISKDLTSIRGEYLVYLRNLIKSSTQFREALSLNEQKQQALGDAFIFSDNNGDTEDNGKIFPIGDNLSKGQKTIKILEKIIDSYDSTKELILDDVFETLDIANSLKLAYKVSERDDKNIVILTHNEDMTEKLISILNNDEANFKYHVVSIDNSSGNPVSVLSGPILQTPYFTFEKLSGDLAQQILTPPNNDQSQLKGFAKIIGRYSTKSSSLFNDFSILPNTTQQFDMYSFSSENVFHYEQNVDVNRFNTLFDLNILVTSRNGALIVDSIDLINAIKNYFPRTGSYFGVQWQKVQDYLDNLIFYLGIEMSLHTRFVRNAGESKGKFLKRCWPNNHLESGKFRSDRNEAMHRLQHSLASLQ